MPEASRFNSGTFVTGELIVEELSKDVSLGRGWVSALTGVTRVEFSVRLGDVEDAEDFDDVLDEDGDRRRLYVRRLLVPEDVLDRVRVVLLLDEDEGIRLRAGGRSGDLGLLSPVLADIFELNRCNAPDLGLDRFDKNLLAARAAASSSALLSRLD
eukprot:GDKJ01014261.1.p2 GENE.GDKJ01014261.1~~GDKJ01014261.1.p2  ORF type:complete len:156 (-),score=11.66 GDKJ01014261.1:18-485(-)